MAKPDVARGWRRSTTAFIGVIGKKLSFYRNRATICPAPKKIQIATEELDLNKIITKPDAGLAEARTGGGNWIVGSSGSEKREFSIDRALKLIESGKIGDLSAHAAGLMLTVLPLLEFADGVLQLDLESINRRLTEHLESGSGSSN